MKKEKRLKKARENPKNVTFEDLAQILEDHGFTLKRSSGSHFLFERTINNTSVTTVVPRHRSLVKAIYVKNVLEIIDEYNLTFTEDTDD